MDHLNKISNIDKVELLKKSINKVVKEKNIYVSVQYDINDGYNTKDYKDIPVEEIEDINKYGIENIGVEESFKTIQGIDEAICGLGSLVDDKLFEIVQENDFEDVDKYNDYIADLRDQFKDMLENKEIKDYLFEKIKSTLD